VVVVAADGSGGFKTVQAAVDAAPAQGEVVRIMPGTYKEKLQITQNGMELRGMGKTPAEVVLTYDDSAKSAGGTGKSGSVNVRGDDFLAENLTIQNDWEKKNARMGEGSQAVALLATGDRQVYRNVRLLGYQDTLYAASKSCHGADDATAGPCQASRMLFEDCYIEGHVDFIFGDAKAAFKNCELHGMTHPMVALTAQSKLFPQEDSGYLFLDCTVTADVAVDKLYFGRPWRAYSTVYFINTNVKGAVVQPEGWLEWKNPDGTGKLATSTYAEYGTVGAKTDKRIAPSKQLTKAEAAKISVGSWLAGTDGWKAEAVR
jgi:pectin methylesterase-like acyl-CoA thioesterase